MYSKFNETLKNIGDNFLITYYIYNFVNQKRVHTLPATLTVDPDWTFL